MLMYNKGPQNSKLDDRQSLCLIENVICLDYVVQIQYYHPIFGKLHDMLFNRDAFFKGVTDHTYDTNSTMG